MKHLISSATFLIFILWLFACADEHPSPEFISNQEGQILYNSDIESLIIAVSIPGTYDSQNIYIPKTELSGFNDGDIVLFSGEITPFATQNLKVFIGQEFYHISISGIKRLD